MLYFNAFKGDRYNESKAGGVKHQRSDSLLHTDRITQSEFQPNERQDGSFVVHGCSLTIVYSMR